MFAKPKLIVIAVLLSFLVTLGWLYRGEVRRAAQAALGVEQLRSEMSTLLEVIQNLQESVERSERLLVERDKELNELRDKYEGVRREARELEDNNEEVKQWADTRIPPAELERLLRQERPSQDGD